VALLKGSSGRVFAVLAEMLEMGQQAGALHEELGRRAARASLSHVWFYGPHSAEFAAGMKAENFDKNLMISNDYDEKLAFDLARMLRNEDIVIVKGSRGMKLERFVKCCEPLDFADKN
jgi:UDP-N-acetylmuramoyl-tripeptide--D-alanyl-D-alanine ligase